MTDRSTFDQITLHRIGLERYSANLVREITAILAEGALEIEDQLRRGVTEGRRENLQRRLANIKQIMAEGHRAVRAHMNGELGALAKYEAEFAKKLYSKFGASFAVPAPQLLASIVKSDPFQGDVLNAWAAKMERNQLSRLRKAIQLGMVLGESVDQIANRVRSMNGPGGASRRGAEALARTAVNHVSNRAHMLVLEENPQLFQTYQWISVLDERTTPICRSRAGKIYQVGRGPVPPAHWRCRSTIAPIVAGMDVDTTSLSYEHWLRDQPAEVVEDILGTTRARLFLKGKLPVAKFTNRTGDELTLEQLRTRESQAWRKAFGTKAGRPKQVKDAIREASKGNDPTSLSAANINSESVRAVLPREPNEPLGSPLIVSKLPTVEQIAEKHQIKRGFAESLIRRYAEKLGISKRQARKLVYMSTLAVILAAINSKDTETSRENPID